MIVYGCRSAKAWPELLLRAHDKAVWKSRTLLDLKFKKPDLKSGRTFCFVLANGLRHQVVSAIILGLGTAEFV